MTSILRNMNKYNIMKHFMDLQLLLLENENLSKSDIDTIEITDELVVIFK